VGARRRLRSARRGGMAMALGLVIAPRRTLRAWELGRRTTNLYREGWSDALLDLTVDELRAKLYL
jgi:hypothetical protein